MGLLTVFDETVEAVQDWIGTHPARQAQILVVVVGDHDTGVVAVNGPTVP